MNVSDSCDKRFTELGQLRKHLKGVHCEDELDDKGTTIPDSSKSEIQIHQKLPRNSVVCPLQTPNNLLMQLQLMVV